MMGKTGAGQGVPFLQEDGCPPFRRYAKIFYVEVTRCNALGYMLRINTAPTREGAYSARIALRIDAGRKCLGSPQGWFHTGGKSPFVSQT